MRNVKVRTEPISGIPESKTESTKVNLEAPIFSKHRAALTVGQGWEEQDKSSDIEQQPSFGDRKKKQYSASK